MLIAMSTAALIALGLLYYAFATRVYESSADVLLVPKRPEVVTRDQRYESGFEDYVSTHLALIVSRMIVERAIESSSLNHLTRFLGSIPKRTIWQTSSLTNSSLPVAREFWARMQIGS